MQITIFRDLQEVIFLKKELTLQEFEQMTFEDNDSIIKDPELAESGEQKIAWAKTHMPIMNEILYLYPYISGKNYSFDSEQFRQNNPLFNFIIVTSIHMEAKTACLVRALAELGAKVYATGCNPLSTQDDVAAALANTRNVEVYAKHGCSNEEYVEYLRHALGKRPHIIIDDGGDLVKLLTCECRKFSDRLIGGCEETTTGILRLKALTSAKKLPFVMYDVNDAECKHNYDNHYGTGQSVIDGILRTTNLILAGKTAVIAGYGDCGSGIAKRLKGMGMKIIITEVDPIKALKANLDGFRVEKMDTAAKVGDLFVTATGCKNVITKKHLRTMKNGALLANAGHFDVEIDVKGLQEIAKHHFKARENIESYELKNGHVLNLLAGGRLVNLAAADGHAAEIMDMSFSIQLLTVLHIAKKLKSSKDPSASGGLRPVPTEIDQTVARYALKAQQINIDKLSTTQKKYLENGF